MPYPEVLFFENRYRVLNSASFLLRNRSDAALFPVFSKGQTKSVDYYLEKHHRITHQGPTQQERSVQKFEFILKAISTDGNSFMKYVSGRDMYGLTAFLVVRLIREMLNGYKLSAGVLSPAEAVSWKGIGKELIDKKFIDVLI